MQLTYLDSNSWLIEIQQTSILLDPWLVGSLTFGNQAWLFEGSRSVTRSIPEHIDLILLSQGLEDHAHPPTLEQLDRQIPVVASPNAAKVVQKLNYHHIYPLEHGESYIHGFEDPSKPVSFKITAVPGSPIGPTLVENGYVIEDLIGQHKIYYEPHGYHSEAVKSLAPIDVVITPIVDLKIPLLGSIIRGQQEALEICQQLQPQVILPTAAGGDVQFSGILNSILQAEGSPESFQSLLQQHGLSTKLINPRPGEKFMVELTNKQETEIG